MDAYNVVHESGALDVDGIIVRVLDLVDVGAVVFYVGSVVNVVAVRQPGDESDRFHPVVRVGGHLCVRHVARVASEAGSEVEQASVGNGCVRASAKHALIGRQRCEIRIALTVLVVVAGVGNGNLPP